MHRPLAQRRTDHRLSYVDQLRQTSQRADAVAADRGEIELLRRRLMRLAFDVHDGPMQALIALGYRVRQMQRHVAEHGVLEHATAARELNGLLTELACTEVSLRSLIIRLEHGHPEIDTLSEIIDGEVATFRTRSEAEVSVSAPPFQPDSASQAIAIRAVLREALSNIAKHADASAVAIRVDAAANGILVEVEDNGGGFDPHAIRADAIGLRSMQQRVALLGGDFAILSRPGGPTILTARFDRWNAQPPPREN